MSLLPAYETLSDGFKALPLRGYPDNVGVSGYT